MPFQRDRATPCRLHGGPPIRLGAQQSEMEIDRGAGPRSAPNAATRGLCRPGPSDPLVRLASSKRWLEDPGGSYCGYRDLGLGEAEEAFAFGRGGAGQETPWSPSMNRSDTIGGGEARGPGARGTDWNCAAVSVRAGAGDAQGYIRNSKPLMGTCRTMGAASRQLGCW